MILSLLAILVAVGIFLFLLDDLHIDLQALLRNLRPRELSDAELRRMKVLPEKRIAVLVANWKEEEVLEFMVRGNSRTLDYENYSFFLGVYPNDLPTWEAARRLEREFSHVHVVVNPLQGPTSKGQLLNELFRQVLRSEESTGMRYDLFLLQDSEDLMHPLSLQLINEATERADFVQIPVFSLSTPLNELVAGVYMDEFAEAHTKDLLVRSALGAPVPSAGVGTALSSRLVRALVQSQGAVLNENCLTEDYQLGLEAARLGFRTEFQCAFLIRNGRKDFVATREFFPDDWRPSVRQKTRWTMGIAFQSAARFGWQGNLLERYFLWRDRRGPWNGLLMLGSITLALGITILWSMSGSLPAFVNNGVFETLAYANFSSMALRILQRMRHTRLVYGWAPALMVPFRWPVGNLINTWAAWRAFRIYHEALKKGEQPRWVKTHHKMPERFGRDLENLEVRA